MHTSQPTPILYYTDSSCKPFKKMAENINIEKIPVYYNRNLQEREGNIKKYEIKIMKNVLKNEEKQMKMNEFYSRRVNF